MKILLLDPDEYYHHEFRRHFQDVAEVIVAREAAAARELLPEADVCVMELLLADAPGYEILKDLREALPVVIYSRVDHPEDIQAALSFGVTGYFVKGRDTINDVKKLLLSFAT